MQRQFDCVKLRFTAPLHLSRGREQFDESAQTLHSDTLSAALFVAARQLGATEPEVLEMLDKVRLSSAFPFKGEEYFFPKPMVPLPFQLKDIPTEKQGKPFKKIRFLGKSWFEKAINGEETLIDTQKHLDQKEYLTDMPGCSVLQTSVTQRVAIQPDNIGDAKPYYVERLFFTENAGLFVLAEWMDDSAKDLLYQAFRLLGDLGVGTDRSVGNGFFEPSFGSLLLSVPEIATHQCALGLYLPEEGELSSTDLDTSAWGLKKRGGYLAGSPVPDHLTLRKRSIYMFEPGSIFPNKPLIGKRVDLRPDWPGLDYAVWREGRPVFVPTKITPSSDES